MHACHRSKFTSICSDWHSVSAGSDLDCRVQQNQGTPQQHQSARATQPALVFDPFAVQKVRLIRNMHRIGQARSDAKATFDHAM